MNADANPFGEPIAVYTRADMIADGDLIQVDPNLSKQAGIPMPVTITRAVWQDCVAWTDADSARKRWPQDLTGRLWDLLWMGRLAYPNAFHQAAATGEPASASFQLHRVSRWGGSREAELVTVQLLLGPDDDARPVVTLCEPG